MTYRVQAHPWEPARELRGRCPCCPYRYGLKKDGTLTRHLLYTGFKLDRKACEGSGKPPVEGTTR